VRGGGGGGGGGVRVGPARAQELSAPPEKARDSARPQGTAGEGRGARARRARQLRTHPRRGAEESRKQALCVCVFIYYLFIIYLFI